MEQQIIVTSNLRKEYGKVVAVDSATLNISRGEMFGLVGPDGAGKTTLIRMLCGILQPTSGSGRIFGYDLLKDSEHLKTKIGYLSQRFSLYGDLTVDENIEFFAEIHHVPGYERRREELLGFTRLAPFRDRLADHLSGGMRQKLALACTLIHTPELIFLDEPTTGVDPVSRREFWRILSNLLKSGITIVMSTPYLDEAERCSRIAMINKGAFMIIDTPSEVKSRMEGEVLEVVTERNRDASKLLKAEGKFEVQTFGDRLNVIVHESSSEIPLVKRILDSAGVGITSLKIIPPSIENVFISFLGKSQLE